jgi:hypothetical protein
MTAEQLEHAQLIKEQQEEEEILKHIKELTIAEMLEILLNEQHDTRTN